MGRRTARAVAGCAAAVTMLAACGGGGTPAGPGGSSTSSPRPSSTSAPSGDPGSDVVGPDQEGNASATRRQDPAPSDSSAAAVELSRMRTALDAQRRRGAVDVASTHTTLRGLGHADDDVQVIDIQEHLGDPAATPGVLLGVATGPATCVVGTLTEQKVVLEVAGTGPPGEYRCVAPVTH